MLPKHEIGKIVEQFYFGEADGAQLIHELPAFAPGKHEKEFCRFWEADENKHEALFADILEEYNIHQETAKQNKLLKGLFSIAWKCVKERNWVKCMTIAAIIEHVALEAGVYIHQRGDKPVQEVIDQILPDEKKHLGFSHQQLQKVRSKKARKDVKDVVMEVKVLAITLGKNNAFTKHDQAIISKAEKKFIRKLRHIGINLPYIESKNGTVRNTALDIAMKARLALAI